MGKEYEAKFLDIDVSRMRRKIKKLGGVLVHENRKYVRSVFKLCNTDIKGYVRVRDEGEEVTITAKIYNNPDYPDEYEISTANSFEEAKNLLEAMNLTMKAFQESYREKWSLPTFKNVHELTFDTLPGIPPYMEVDCNTEDALYKVIDALKLNKDKMRKGAFDRTYKEYYGIKRDTINLYTPSITFKNILTELDVKKNRDLLKKIHKEQMRNIESMDSDNKLSDSDNATESESGSEIDQSDEFDSSVSTNTDSEQKGGKNNVRNIYEHNKYRYIMLFQ
jgi:hypothetical protein